MHRHLLLSSAFLLGLIAVPAADADVTGLNAQVTGSGTIKIGHIDGPGAIDIRGSGDVAIDDGALPTLSVEVRGSGNAKLARGKVGTLAASVAGSGNIRIDGTVKDASLSSAGSGDIDIEKVTGSVQSSKAGSGKITVGK
jgi:hypothetical protein